MGRNWLPRLKHGLRETQQANHNLAENLNVTFEFLFSLSCPGKTLFELGPVNTCFAPGCCVKNARARREAQGIVGLWPSFATQHPLFSCATQREGTDFIQPFVAHRLQRPALPRGSCPRDFGWMKSVAAKQVLTGPKSKPFSARRQYRPAPRGKPYAPSDTRAIPQHSLIR